MAGYTRQSAADIATDEDILAAPLNNEFNAIEDAFNGSSGHNHQGGTGNGPKISLTAAVSGTLPVANGGTGGATQSAARTGLGLGTVSTQNSDAVAITGGTITGITDLAIADGGTGASTASAAFDALKQEATDSATGVVELATVAEFRDDTAGAKALTPEKVWDAAEEVTLTDAASIAVDMDTFINATVTLSGNRTLENPTNAKPGQSGCIRIVQGSGGNKTLSYGANWYFVGGTNPTLSTSANDEDLLFYHVINSSKIFASLAKDIG